MKVLFVDDSAKRVEKLKAQLNATDSLDVEITHAQSASEARGFLEKHSYSLMILDINLPQRNGAPDPNVSIELIDQISESSALSKPAQIIGITEYDDAYKLAAPRFFGRLWNIVKTDEMNGEWVASVVASIDWVKLSRADETKHFRCDLLVLAALAEPEMDAVYALPWLWQSDRPSDATTFVRECLAPAGDRQIRVVTSCIGRMGMVPTATRATKLLAQFTPRACVMVGICAGQRDKTNIGDIVFADPVWDYQSGKSIYSEDLGVQFQIAPHQIAATEWGRARFEQMRRDVKWLAEVRTLGGRASDLKLHIGPFASGAAVLADGVTLEQFVKSQQRQVLAIDMEMYGHYFASSQATEPRPCFFGIKSVCDFADPKKGDSDQKYAAYTSAKALQRFVELYFNELLK